MPQPIIIVDYNSQWPVIYENEKARILGAIGQKLVSIEHIGSTAVPGLGSKPIIDIMAAVHRMADSLECIEPLQALGYEYYYYPEFPERCVFLDGSVGAGPHHLHMTEFQSEFWTTKLLFRDYLRAHPEAVEEYYRLKKKWAKKYGADRDKYEDYTEAKPPFVESVITKARAELKS
jgi:GrpB-like predicted nucleotidyltransferase (UPF0157 family)